jgi:UDP-N-acetylglucosamine diphosphorylase / glucose-1-phosphate thymidylyltransferase / UDP-N-acetylgalactosamine diphosphorylase / glucosamine-1-phosphate N-acetyltransferase / galactosamine-1-phosphate N-acetyltransferase
MDILKAENFFDLTHFEHRDLFSGCGFVWQAIGNVSPYIQSNLKGNVKAIGCFRIPLPQTVVLWRGEVWREGFDLLGGDVTKESFRVRIGGEETSEATVIYSGSVLWDEHIQLGKGTVIEPGALIKGPTIIGRHTEVRQGAYIRGKCVIGDRCVVGHTTEMKSSMMLNDAKAGHFAYIGDSILGNACNLGAGTKLANLKVTESTVLVRVGKESVDTGMRKLGAIIGDRTEIGCNSVTNPGSLLGKGCIVLPVISVPAGYYEPRRIVR